MAQRKIIHVDMDAFYASVEQRDDPSLVGRPVIVGGTPEGRGVVAAASYEARRFGIRSAMSAAKAKRLCPQAVFLRPRFERYHEASQQIRAIFHHVTDLVEPLSLDEAFLDVTHNKLGEAFAAKIAKGLKAEIRETTGLTASAGVGPNKLIAKLASDLEKPDGLVVIPPERVDAFLRPLPVRKLWGVGPATERRLESIGIHTVEDLRRVSEVDLHKILGSFGPFLRSLAFGQDERLVSPNRIAKSRGAERTLAVDVNDRETVVRMIGRLAERVADGPPGRTVSLKIRYGDFTTLTRSLTLENPTANAKRIAMVAVFLLSETEVGHRPVRLVGVSLSTFVGGDDPIQLELPLDEEDT